MTVNKMSFNSNWSSEDDELLIDFVRNHEAIYNVKSKEYRQTQMKLNLWREIGDILNKTDCDCSKRWCYVRDYYIRRRGKPGTGSSGIAAKKRSDLLSFLDSLPSLHRNSLTNVIDENSGDRSLIIENTHDYGEETQPYTQETEDLIFDSNEDDNDKLDRNKGHNLNNDIVRKQDNNTKSDKKRKNNSLAQERLNLLKQIVQRKHSTQNELDETELFFSSMAKIVKKLPRYEQAHLRMEIGSLVGNAELRHISNDSPQSSASSPRPSTGSCDYYENVVPSPKSTTSASDYSQVIAPSPSGTRIITVNDQGEIYFVPQTND